jgi:hypothetical protein
MMVYTDEPWAYRKKLREQIQVSPRAAIQQVGAGGDEQKLHPIDRRRVDYFVALSQAIKSKRAGAVRRLATFASPYDPLLSYFSHHEVARLYARSEPREFAAELMHRLHDIHFADPADRSVRNVADAITLLVEHPQSQPDPIRRWDHINALLQVMERRWQLRTSETPESAKVAMRDVELSISAMKVGFEGMHALLEPTGMSASDWALRRNHLERSVIRPLRTYRSQLMPHYQRALRPGVEQASAAQSVP